MKKILAIFISLIVIFLTVWIVKAKSPILRPDSYANGYDENNGVWWQTPLNVEVDEKWILDPEIPQNYLPVPGEEETYMVIDDDGNIVQYRHRDKQNDGSWVWKDVVKNDIPDDYEPVAGLQDIYKTIDKNGKIKYYKYIRNDDNTYAFIPVDEKGNLIDDKTPTDSTIPENYVHVQGNIYAILNEYGVVIGYKERTLNKDGSYSWKNVSKPQQSTTTTVTTTAPVVTTNPNSGNSGGSQTTPPVTQVNADGTYTEIETLFTTETSGGWIITYETTVTRVYDSKGKLLSTKKDGPREISRTQANNSNSDVPNPSQVSSNLNSEVARISTGINFKTQLANEVLAKLNAERVSEGLAPLKMDVNNDCYKIAKARASAMAKYNYSDYDSPLYGTLKQMLSKFNITSSNPSENTWKTTSTKSANDIHSRFMVLDGARQARMSSQYTTVGIVIAEKNGYYYVCEVFI